MKLSILIPVFNEEKTITQTLEQVSLVNLKGVTKEVIVIDDGSTDITAKNIAKLRFPELHIHVHKHIKNMGKAEAIKTGLKHAKGDYVIIQDADLEYDPKYISLLLQPIMEKRTSVVYGTRLDRMPHLNDEEKIPQTLLHYFGNRALSLLTSMLYGQWITDMETGYKIFPRHAIRVSDIRTKGFAIEPEITAMLIKNGYKIFEVPIKTKPRRYNEGKKLHTLQDGISALITIISCRF